MDKMCRSVGSVSDRFIFALGSAHTSLDRSITPISVPVRAFRLFLN